MNLKKKNRFLLVNLWIVWLAIEIYKCQIVNFTREKKSNCKSFCAISSSGKIPHRSQMKHMKLAHLIPSDMRWWHRSKNNDNEWPNSITTDKLWMGKQKLETKKSDLDQQQREKKADNNNNDGSIKRWLSNMQCNSIVQIHNCCVNNSFSEFSLPLLLYRFWVNRIFYLLELFPHEHWRHHRQWMHFQNGRMPFDSCTREIAITKYALYAL